MVSCFGLYLSACSKTALWLKAQKILASETQRSGCGALLRASSDRPCSCEGGRRGKVKVLETGKMWIQCNGGEEVVGKMELKVGSNR